ncbi:MAG: hypothetical protein LBH36_02990 [Candidatus Nomurabacteria bacterium]|jgi:hypothetical protein|nr:hypothetical protein [Candidatus Nomurabacteria bacterium]
MMNVSRKQQFCRTATKFGLLAVAVLAGVVLINAGSDTNAADKNDWIAGNIISDSVFTDSDGMSEADIQNFLNQKIGNCDVWGQQPSEYGGGTRAQYAAAAGWHGPPYTCLNKYYEVPKQAPGGDMPANNFSNPDSIPDGAKSAAWIIKDAANRYGINPKVLLVKIATESVGPLTSDQWPLFSQYKYAMGSHCPDSGPGGSANCDPAYAGFSIQIYSAAELMRWYLDSMNEPWWSYKKPYQNNSILWNVAPRGCGAGDVYIESKATAALYTYTPYQPNAAALSNMYGTGDNCSAYGNRNFWRTYVDWFGNPRGQAYVWQELSQEVYYSDSKLKEVDRSAITQGQYVYIEYIVKNVGHKTWPKSSVLIGRTSNSPFCIADWLACSRATIVNKTADVRPGDTATFGFWMQAPQKVGTYKSDWNLLIENVSWFVDIGSYHSLTIVDKKPSDRLDDRVDVMRAGDIIYSPNRNNVLTLLLNGELSVYHRGQNVFNVAKDVYQLRTQQDGNLVAYNKYGSPLWVVGDGNRRALVITNDGKLIYQGYEGEKDIQITDWSAQNSRKVDSLKVEGVLFQHQTIYSANGKYMLILQGDGNLVQYGPKGAEWSTKTSNGCFLVQQNDGKLVLYSCTGSPVWHSSVWLFDGSRTTTHVQNDGNLVTYDGYKAVWWK